MGRAITLFSPYSPDLGGGGTNLRSLIPELRGFEIEWLYTATRASSFPRSTCVAPFLAGGPVWRDLSRVVALWTGVPTTTLVRVLSAMRARSSDKYWVVGHGEGIVVARALARAGARVHLSIQDDVPDGVFARSQRYRALAPFVRPTFEATLRRMASIDVTSDGMQRYYAERLGLSTVVVHPFVSVLPPASTTAPPASEIRVGHVGSIYAVDAWRSFLQALQVVAKETGRRAKMIMIGLAPKYRAAAREFGDVVEIQDDLPEPDAVARISTCHFLYAMYPFDARSTVFRTTSLPTKLTTYLKSRRPIFGHSPAGSTLLEIVDQFGIGLPCTTTAISDIADRIRRFLALSVPDNAYERAREEVYGTGNVERLRACLERL